LEIFCARRSYGCGYLDCWNTIMGANDPLEKHVLSRDMDLCEECGEWKPVIIRIRKRRIAPKWFCEQMDYFEKDRGK
ncbi:MAG: hypothetical protein SPG04_05545, partial [Candidatus Heritagella sp.]|nr:hypothetical protein [Candidatus Heritagella sp.]